MSNHSTTSQSNHSIWLLRGILIGLISVALIFSLNSTSDRKTDNTPPEPHLSTLSEQFNQGVPDERSHESSNNANDHQSLPSETLSHAEPQNGQNSVNSQPASTDPQSNNVNSSPEFTFYQSLPTNQPAETLMPNPQNQPNTSGNITHSTLTPNQEHKTNLTNVTQMPSQPNNTVTKNTQTPRNHSKEHSPERPTSNPVVLTPATPASNSLTNNQKQSMDQYSSESVHKKHYILQTGSFKHQTEADRLRARLILHGYNPTIQSVTLKDNQTWHRVLIGPFNTSEGAEEVQSSLTRIKVQSQLRSISG